MKLRIFNPRESSLLLGVLIVAFVGNFFTSAKIALILLFILSVGARKFAEIVDVIFLFLFLFLMFYFINNAYSGVDDINVKLTTVLFPSLLYLLGKWYGRLCSCDSNFLFLQIIIGLLLSLITVLSVFLSIYQDGFTGLSRSIEVIGADNSVLNATVMGGNLIILISIAGVLFSPSHQISLRIRILIGIALILALVVVLRLGSRTHLIIAAVSITIGYIVNRKDLSRVFRLVFYFSVILVALVVDRVVDRDSLISTYFADRINDASSSASSAGGRLDRWIGSLDLLFVNPFGWSFDLIGFSHNLWLDTARVGGWGAFFFLALFTGYSLYKTKKALDRSKGSRIFVTSTICLTIGFYFLFFVEPILDGFLYPFAAYCVFLGAVMGFRGDSNCRV